MGNRNYSGSGLESSLRHFSHTPKKWQERVSFFTPSKSNNFIMKNQLIKIVLSVLLLFLPNFCFSQYLELGVLSSCEAYTGSGAVTNSGTFTGDAGTYAGILTGFVPPNFTGDTHNSDAMTTQARTDLFKAYIHLSNLFVTYPGAHTPAFGGGEIITPGVYSIAGAGSIAGNVTLDGGGNTNAIFIIKFGGALTIGAGSTVFLSNGTRACNVLWIAQGAISLAAKSIIKGTLLSYPGAISLGGKCNLEGRMFTSAGAITIGDGSVVIAPAGPITVPVDCSNSCAPAPAVDVLGSAANFALFTGTGAVANSGTSGIIGDIGTNAGDISGFDTSEQIGSVYSANAITAQAILDLDKAYNQLMLLPNTVISHTPAFGTGETLTAGVYYINGAGSLGGTITLDGKNNNDAIFIFKFAGAFAVAAQSKVILTNGVRRCNVFWIGGAGVTTGAVSIGAASHIKGIFISHGGACTSGAGTNVEGRMLSTAGAIGFSTGAAYNSPVCVVSRTPLPVELLSFTAVVKGVHVQLNWATATEMNNDYFNVERSTDAINFTSISKISGAGNSTQILNYSLVDNAPLKGKSYYRLKQTDYNKKTRYSHVSAISCNNTDNFISNIYPNPNDGHGFNFEINKNNNEEVLMILYDALGKEIYSKIIITNKNSKDVHNIIPPQKLNPGIYLLTAISGNEIYTKRLMVSHSR